MPVNDKYTAYRVDESKLKKRNRELAFLAEMSHLLAISTNLENLLRKALFKVLGFFGMDAGRIYLLDGQGKFLHLHAYVGMQPDGFEKQSLYEGFSGQAVRSRSLISQNVSALKDRERMNFLLKKGFKSIVCVPLITKDKVIGVMNLATGEDTIDLSESKRDLFTTIGSQIAIAAMNAKLYSELQDKISRLEQREETIKCFTYSVTHDLKGPAIGIHGITKRLLDRYSGQLDDSGKACSYQLLKASGHMLVLVNQINDYISSKEAPLYFEPFNLKEITGGIREEFSDRFEERKIKWSEPDVLPEIVADKLSMMRVFRNLIDNALKYGGDEMLEIEMGYDQDDAFHLLSIRNDGIPIREEDKKKIFERFQRDPASKGISGSGLGLSIVIETAQRHKGRAWVTNGTMKGTTFYLSILKGLKPSHELCHE
jgi:signal transduction histidine kinase